MATKIDSLSAEPIKKTVNMTSLFNAHLAQTPKKPMPPAQKEEEAIQVSETKESNLEENLAEKEKIC